MSGAKIFSQHKGISLRGARVSPSYSFLLGSQGSTRSHYDNWFFSQRKLETSPDSNAL